MSIESRQIKEKPVPTKVIFNPPATIVFWSDGDKIVVKCREEDTFDKRTGLAMSYMRKFAADEYSKVINTFIGKKTCDDQCHANSCKTCRYLFVPTALDFLEGIKKNGYEGLCLMDYVPNTCLQSVYRLTKEEIRNGCEHYKERKE